MRRARTQRHGVIDVAKITLGDYIILFGALLTLISLFLPWMKITTPISQSYSAFTYSEVAGIIVIVFFLAILFLVIYPALSPDLRLPPLPFSTPLVFMTMGALLLLIYFYELGKYGCVLCSSQGESRGIGVWIGLLGAIVFIIGSVIRWGARPSRNRFDTR